MLKTAEAPDYLLHALQMPFYRNSVNVVWCSIWFGLLYTAIWFVVSIFQQDQSYDARRKATLVGPTTSSYEIIRHIPTLRLQLIPVSVMATLNRIRGRGKVIH